MILGTAQFGMDYGITNLKGKINNENLVNIIKFCNRNKISELDTAFGYGDAHNRLANVLNKYYRKKTIITTKTNLNDFYNYNILKKKILNLKYIFSNSDVNLLCHDEKILLKKNKLLLDNLLKLKKDKIIKKIGVSVYSASLALNGLKNKNLDIIQISSNILDQRILNKKIVKYLDKIYCRSIFLQGILINKNKFKNKFFTKIISILNPIEKKYNLTKIELCIYYILKVAKVKKFIIGVESAKQLKQVYKSFIKIKKMKIDNRITKKIKKLSCTNTKIIDPRKWPKKLY